MTSYINLFRLATWKLWQPLVAVPSSAKSVVSDLFVWRNSSIFKTYFELTSIPSLFENISPYQRHATIFIFDACGCKINEQILTIEPCMRRTLDLSYLLPNESGSCGTFAIFHSHTPDSVSTLGSFVAERGYVGYSYQSSILLSYAHGNLDAVAFQANSPVQMLGRSSLRRRSYMLQHLLTPPYYYEIAVVNPTNSSQTIRFDVLSICGRLLQTSKVSLKSRALHFFPVSPEHENLKIVLHSRLVMARPLVFRSHDSGLDVFHG